MDFNMDDIVDFQKESVVKNRKWGVLYLLVAIIAPTIFVMQLYNLPLNIIVPVLFAVIVGGKAGEHFGKMQTARDFLSNIGMLDVKVDKKDNDGCGD